MGATIVVVGDNLLHPLAVRMERAKSRVGREIRAADYVVEVRPQTRDNTSIASLG